MEKKEIFIRQNETIKGPLEKSHLKDLVRSQELLLTDEVGPTREGPWKTVKDIPTLVSQIEQSSNYSSSKDDETNGLVSPTPDNSKDLQNDKSSIFAGDALLSLLAAVLAFLFVFPLFGIGQTWLWSGIWVTIIFFFAYGSNIFGKAQDLVEVSLLLGIPICGLLTVGSWLVGFPIFQNDRLPSGLDTNAVAKAFAGHWTISFPPTTLPNGEVKSTSWGVEYVWSPTKYVHGTWKYDNGKASGEWRIMPDSDDVKYLQERSDGYWFWLDEVRLTGQDFNTGTNTIVDKLTKNSFELVTEKHGIELSRAKATRQ